jgi:hypothetical protein
MSELCSVLLVYVYGHYVQLNWGDFVVIYEGYLKSNLQWAVNKTSNKEQIIVYKKYVHTRKLVLNIVTVEIEALVVSGNTFLYACIKEICPLWAQPHFDTFHQLSFIVEALWSQPVFQVGKRMVVAWSDIRAVRRLVKQLPVEMLQQCSSANSCMRMRFVMEEHYTGYQHSMPFVLNGQSYAVFLVFHDTLLTLLWSCVAWIPPSSLFYCNRKQLPSAFWQADNVCLNFFGLFGECVCIHSLDCFLISTFTNET